MLLISMGVFLQSCAQFPNRGYYDRETGSWVTGSDSKKPASTQTSKPQSNQGPKPPGSADPATVPRSDLKSITDSWIGTPYAFGQSQRGVGTDCSGFVTQAMKEWRGLNLPRHSQSLFLQGRAIPMDNLQPGDIVFFGPPSYIDHTGIYMGNNLFAHASSTLGVEYRSLDDPYWVKRIKGARRYDSK